MSEGKEKRFVGEVTESPQAFANARLEAVKSAATFEWKRVAMVGIVELGKTVLDGISRSPSDTDDCAELLREAAAITYSFYYELSRGIGLIHEVGANQEPQEVPGVPVFTIPPLSEEHASAS